MVDTEFYVPEDKQSRLVAMYEYDAGKIEKADTFDSKHIHFIDEYTKAWDLASILVMVLVLVLKKYLAILAQGAVFFSGQD